MPEVKPEKILSFSNEDRGFPVSNLLKVNAFSKWKCQNPGEKHAVVTFSFGEPLQFSRIDIGNESSAFIQVEVSRSASSGDYEVLLPTSSFMSPADAKKSVSLNRVRIFSGTELTPSVSSQKWDIVRVTCTQPFNKELQFGLSFIRFYSTLETNESEKEQAIDLVQGSSSQESSTNDALKPGALFQLTRELSKGQSALATTSEDIKPAIPATITQKLLKANQSVMNSQPTTSSKPAANSPKPKSASSSVADDDDDGANNAIPSTSNAATDASNGQSIRSKILDGVIVAFSGYKNPFRSELRDLCLKLGAKYRQDWTNDCTHLICAFPNTPKWRTIKGKGVITSHRWIQACSKAKRRVSWRPYRVGRAPSPVGYVSDTPKPGDNEAGDGESDSDWERSLVEDDASDDWKPGGDDNDDEDEEESRDSDASAEEEEEEEEDSDEDGARPSKRLHKKPAGGKGPQPKRSRVVSKPRSKPDPESEDTDEEIQRQLGTDNGSTSSSTAQRGKALPTDLPDILIGKKFYIFSKNLDFKEEELVYRLIITFGGKVEQYMTANVDYVISRASWCDDFDEALNVCPTLVFVKPEWIYACDKAAKLVPFQRYQVVG